MREVAGSLRAPGPFASIAARARRSRAPSSAASPRSRATRRSARRGDGAGPPEAVAPQRQPERPAGARAIDGQVRDVEDLYQIPASKGSAARVGALSARSPAQCSSKRELADARRCRSRPTGPREREDTAMRLDELNDTDAKLADRALKALKLKDAEVFDVKSRDGALTLVTIGDRRCRSTTRASRRSSRCIRCTRAARSRARAADGSVPVRGRRAGLMSDELRRVDGIASTAKADRSRPADAPALRGHRARRDRRANRETAERERRRIPGTTRERSGA